MGSCKYNWFLAFVLTLFIKNIIIVYANSDNNNNNNNVGICQSLGGEFKFDAVPPKKQSDLTFCKEYKSLTCCKSSHTQLLLKRIYPFFNEDFESNEKCKQLSASIYCSYCSPDIGTKNAIGICESFCQTWFMNCRNSLFTENDNNNQLQPCNTNSMICSPLLEIVSSGKEFCEKMGFIVGKASHEIDNEYSLFSRNIDDLKQQYDNIINCANNNNNYNNVACFDPLNANSNAGYSMPNYRRAEDINKEKKSSNKTNYFNINYWLKLLNLQRFIDAKLAISIIIGLLVGFALYIKMRFFPSSNNSSSMQAMLNDREHIRKLRAEKLQQQASHHIPNNNNNNNNNTSSTNT